MLKWLTNPVTSTSVATMPITLLLKGNFALEANQDTDAGHVRNKID